MNKFIEVHVDGQPYLINTRWIEAIHEHTILLALYRRSGSTAEKEHIDVDETYEQLKELIWR